MTIPRIATVVKGDTLESFLTNLAEIQLVSDLIELRVDYIKNLKIEDLKQIKAKTNKLAIFTCRKKDEGGSFLGTEKARIAIIQKAIDLEFSYVDIELSTLEKHKIDKKNGVKLIVSYHDFKNTPDIEFLQDIVDKAYKLGADIAKVAVYANSLEDSKIILRLILDKESDKEIIALAMGEYGKITRVMAPLIGAYLTFASISGEGTAPGQIDIDKLKLIYNNISN